jgi:osmotically-inducible protein OsmY
MYVVLLAVALAAGPPGADRELESAVKARFQRSKIAADNFQVKVQGGVVYLDGRTDVIQRKGTATRLARLAGAKQVVNRIGLSEAARAKAAANLKKGRRRAQVKRGEPRSERAP